MPPAAGGIMPPDPWTGGEKKKISLRGTGGNSPPGGEVQERQRLSWPPEA